MRRSFFLAVSFALLLSFTCTSATPAQALRQETPTQSKSGLEELEQKFREIATAAGPPLPEQTSPLPSYTTAASPLSAGLEEWVDPKPFRLYLKPNLDQGQYQSAVLQGFDPWGGRFHLQMSLSHTLWGREATAKLNLQLVDSDGNRGDQTKVVLLRTNVLQGIIRTAENDGKLGPGIWGRIFSGGKVDLRNPETGDVFRSAAFLQELAASKDLLNAMERERPTDRVAGGLGLELTKGKESIVVFTTAGDDRNQWHPIGQIFLRNSRSGYANLGFTLLQDVTVTPVSTYSPSPAAGVEEVSARISGLRQVTLSAGQKTVTLSFDTAVLEPLLLSPDQKLLVVRTTNRNLYAHDLSKLSSDGTAPRKWNYSVSKGDVVRFSDDGRRVLLEHSPATKRQLPTTLALDAQTGQPAAGVEEKPGQPKKAKFNSYEALKTTHDTILQQAKQSAADSKLGDAIWDSWLAIGVLLAQVETPSLAWVGPHQEDLRDLLTRDLMVLAGYYRSHYGQYGRTQAGKTVSSSLDPAKVRFHNLFGNVLSWDQVQFLVSGNQILAFVQSDSEKFGSVMVVLEMPDHLIEKARGGWRFQSPKKLGENLFSMGAAVSPIGPANRFVQEARIAADQREVEQARKVTIAEEPSDAVSENVPVHPVREKLIYSYARRDDDPNLNDLTFILRRWRNLPDRGSLDPAVVAQYLAGVFEWRLSQMVEKLKEADQITSKSPFASEEDVWILIQEVFHFMRRHPKSEDPAVEILRRIDKNEPEKGPFVDAVEYAVSRLQEEPELFKVKEPELRQLQADLLKTFPLSGPATAGLEEKRGSELMTVEEILELVAREKKAAGTTHGEMYLYVYGKLSENSDDLRQKIESEIGRGNNVPVPVYVGRELENLTRVFVGRYRKWSSASSSPGSAKNNVQLVYFENSSETAAFLAGRDVTVIHLGNQTIRLFDVDHRVKEDTLRYAAEKVTPDIAGVDYPVASAIGGEVWLGYRNDPRLQDIVQTKMSAAAAAELIEQRGIVDWYTGGQKISAIYGHKPNPGWNLKQWIQRIAVQPFGDTEVKLAFGSKGDVQVSTPFASNPKDSVVVSVKMAVAPNRIQQPPGGAVKPARIINDKGIVIAEKIPSGANAGDAIERAIYQAIEQRPVIVTIHGNTAYIGRNPSGGQATINRVVALDDQLGTGKAAKPIPGAFTQIKDAKVRWVHIDHFGTVDLVEGAFAAGAKSFMHLPIENGQVGLTILGNEAWVGRPTAGLEETPKNVSFTDALSAVRGALSVRPQLDNIRIVGNKPGEEGGVTIQQYDSSSEGFVQMVEHELRERFGAGASSALYSIRIDGPRMVIAQPVHVVFSNGRTKLAVGVNDENGLIGDAANQPLPVVWEQVATGPSNVESQAHSLAAIQKLARSALEFHQINPDRLEQIGFATTGFGDFPIGMISMANLQEHGFGPMQDLKSSFERAFENEFGRRIPVFFVNDGLAGVLGEHNLPEGALSDVPDGIFVIVGGGVGSGEMEDGKPVYAVPGVIDAFLNEIGWHIVTTDSGTTWEWRGEGASLDSVVPRPASGEREWSLEQHMGGPFLAARAVAWMRDRGRGDVETFGQEIPIEPDKTPDSLSRTRRPLVPSLDLQTVVLQKITELGLSGDPDAIEFIRDSGRALGAALRAFRERFKDDHAFARGRVAIGSSVGEKFGAAIPGDPFLAAVREAAGTDDIVRSTKTGVKREWAFSMPKKTAAAGLEENQKLTDGWLNYVMDDLIPPKGKLRQIKVGDQKFSFSGADRLKLLGWAQSVQKDGYLKTSLSDDKQVLTLFPPELKGEFPVSKRLTAFSQMTTQIAIEEIEKNAQIKRIDHVYYRTPDGAVSILEGGDLTLQNIRSAVDSVADGGRIDLVVSGHDRWLRPPSPAAAGLEEGIQMGVANRFMAGDILVDIGTGKRRFVVTADQKITVDSVSIQQIDENGKRVSEQKGVPAQADFKLRFHVLRQFVTTLDRHETRPDVNLRPVTLAPPPGGVLLLQWAPQVPTEGNSRFALVHIPEVEDRSAGIQVLDQPGKQFQPEQFIPGASQGLDGMQVPHRIRVTAPWETAGKKGKEVVVASLESIALQWDPANGSLEVQNLPAGYVLLAHRLDISPEAATAGMEEDRAFVQEVIDAGKLGQLLEAGETGSALVLPVVSLSSRNDLYLQEGLQRPADLPGTVRVETLPDQLTDVRDLLQGEVVQDSDLILLNANIVGDQASQWIPKLDTHPGIIRITPEQSVSARTEGLAASAAWSRLIGGIVDYGSLRITYVTVGEATYAVVRSA